jgi:hypothetical protein
VPLASPFAGVSTLPLSDPFGVEWEGIHSEAGTPGLSNVCFGSAELPFVGLGILRRTLWSPAGLACPTTGNSAPCEGGL